MSPGWKKRMLAVALGAVVLALAAFALMVAKDRTYVPSAPYAPRGEPNREVAVVYYSRSGHSEAVAREIARTFNAPIARIDADYPRDFAGQSKAVADAQEQALPGIRVEPIDLVPALARAKGQALVMKEVFGAQGSSVLVEVIGGTDDDEAKGVRDYTPASGSIVKRGLTAHVASRPSRTGPAGACFFHEARRKELPCT